jgi:hypothetical protein
MLPTESTGVGDNTSVQTASFLSAADRSEVNAGAQISRARVV